MADLKTFLHRQNKKLLDSSIQQLRAGIVNRLHLKYTPLYGEEKAGHLGIALLNRCLLEEPADMEGKIFYQNHTGLVEEELLKLSADVYLVTALSYLYAAEILYSKPGKKNAPSKHSDDLTRQAARIKVPVPDINELCGASDTNECVIEIMKFAAEFYLDNHPEQNNTD